MILLALESSISLTLRSIVRYPITDDTLPILLFLRHFQVQREKFLSPIVGLAKAVSLEYEIIKLCVEFGELGGAFVEVFVVEFGDAPLFFLHLGAAILVKIDRCFADGFDLFGDRGLREGEGFKTGVVGVARVAF